MTDVSASNRIRLEIDRELCYGFGDCVSSAPEVFDLDAEDKAVVIDPDGLGVDDIMEAAQNCPVDAIIVFDEDGTQLFP
jgi:ferredoxin